jgi:hypothetical protein
VRHLGWFDRLASWCDANTNPSMGWTGETSEGRVQLFRWSRPPADCGSSSSGASASANPSMELDGRNVRATGTVVPLEGASRERISNTFFGIHSKLC